MPKEVGLAGDGERGYRRGCFLGRGVIRRGCGMVVGSSELAMIGRGVSGDGEREGQSDQRKEGQSGEGGVPGVAGDGRMESVQDATRTQTGGPAGGAWRRLGKRGAARTR